MNSDEAGPSAAEPSSNNVAPPSNVQLDPPHDTEAARASESAFFRFSRKRRLDDLISTLDRVVWVEMAVLYYMDNSFLRFLLRSMVQIVYLMPKPPPFPEPLNPQPVVGAVIGMNTLCIFLHLYSFRPAAGEATRGYLHGGLLLDFIGQQGPTCKLHLIFLDLLILFLQLIALAVTVQRKDLEKKPTSASPIQDHDAEERGEHRETSRLAESLSLEEGVDSIREESQRQGSVSLNLPHEYAQSDAIASGQAMITEIYIGDTVLQQYNAYQEFRASAATTGAGQPVQINFRQRRYELNLPFRS